MINKILFALAALLFLMPALVYAATINVASCSYSDVQAAVDAASPEDTVNVPAGNCTWNKQLVITKGIILKGAGVGSTVISVDHTDYAFLYQPGPGTTSPFRLSGFEFNLNNKAGAYHLINTNSVSAITNVRIDHNSFLNGNVGSRGNSIWVQGPIFGVVDNNVIMGQMHMDNYAQCSCNDWAPTAPEFSLGSANNMFYEDNNITSDNAFCTGGWGGRYIYRYNTFNYTGSVGQFPAFDMHGNQPSGVISPRGGEIYENTINVVGSHCGRMFDQRGGTMVIHNNYYYYYDDCWDFQVREEYCNSISCGGAYDMNVKDSYYWNNFNNDVLFTIDHISLENSCTEYNIEESKNYWVQRASFNGTVGMGVGLLSARPTTCTLGVGYWATDMTTLYRCNPANTWATYYTPYTYPHPLRTDCVNYPGLCDSGPSQPEAYWVSPTGTSAWANCQSATPLSGASACSLTTANANAAAGDTIYLRGGTYSGITGSAINPSNTGTAGNIITFSSYNGEDVQLIGSGTSSMAVDLDSEYGTIRSYIKVHDLHFTHFMKHLWIRKGSHNEISHCSFIGYPAEATLINFEGTWSASYIYRQATYNWIHHSTFGDWGFCEPYGTDVGVVFQVGLETSTTDYTKYNLVEYNTMYHGGHHVISFNGVNNVYRYNSFRNDPWCPLGNPTYGTRTMFQTGATGDGQYNLVEGNRIGYGGPKNKDEIGGAGGTLSGAYNIWRKNVFLQIYTDGMWVTYYGSPQSYVMHNRVYNNNFWHGGYGSYQKWPGGTVPSPYWDTTYTHAIDVGEGDGTEVFDNAFINNIFYENNNEYGKAYSIISFGDGGTHLPPIHQVISNNWLDNAGDPKFVDISGTPNPTLIATQFDFHLQSDSPCIDQGGFLTTITSSSGSGTQFQVADAGYFMDGWGIIEGDIIQLQGQTAKARIVSVDYSTNTITLNITLSWTLRLGVSLAYEGNAPDIGAYESSGSAPPQCVAADINCDGMVNLVDLKLVASDFGKTSGLNNAKSDTNSNGIVDIFDVVYVASRFT